jgi:glycine/D-amino acid oxidase-like deaminating enzyme
MIWAKWYPLETSELMARVGNMTLNRFANLEEELETSIEYNIESTIACIKAGEEEECEPEILELERYFDTKLEFLKPEEIKKMAPYIGVDNYESFGGYLLRIVWRIPACRDYIKSFGKSISYPSCPGKHCQKAGHDYLYRYRSYRHYR